MDIMASPWRSANDSPSRQLLWELGQLTSSREAFNAQLDRENEDRAILHRQALEAASAQHDRVRRTAEQYRERLEQQIQAERRRREEETQKEIDKLCREKEEEEQAAKRREIERARTAEAEKKRAAEIRRREKSAADERKANEEQQDAEIARRLEVEKRKESLQREQVKAAEAKAKEAASAAQLPLSVPTTKSSAPPAQLSQPSHRVEHQNPALEAEHQKYLEVHQRLKELRKAMASQAKQNPTLKTVMGDMRREIKKCVGQLRQGKGTNRSQLQKIMNVLKKAVTVTELAIDMPLYLASPPSQIADTKGPALLVYLLNIFAKAIISQFIDEAGVKPQLADPVGTIASHVFAVANFRWQDMSLIDILIAKFHVTCPVLFGICGDERSVQGKQRLGWSREEENGPFIPEQRHFERMTGLGAGYAAISLRNYEKALAKNPYPDHHYWQALARITNIPSNRITQTHFVVLKGMIQGYEAKLLHFFGGAAAAALRHALIELPNRSPPSVAAKALAGLVDVLKRDQKLTL